MSSGVANHRLAQVLVAEFLGTAMLLCVVVGSGIMAQRLSGGNVAIALLANTMATVFALYVLIESLGPISGAHFNPLVTAIMGPPADLWRGENNATNWQLASIFKHFVAIKIIVVQLLGATSGTWLAHAMFELDVWQWGTQSRSGAGQWLAEGLATACLLFVIARSTQVVGSKASVWVACTIGAAYWFTASTSFANPAAVLGRMLTTSFSGISPADALGGGGGEALGAWVGWRVAKWLA